MFNETFKKFNPLKKWVYCKNNIKTPFDQGKCGICGVKFLHIYLFIYILFN